MAGLLKSTIAILVYTWSLIAIPVAPLFAEQTPAHSLLPVPKNIVLTDRFKFPDAIILRLSGVPDPKIIASAERFADYLKAFIKPDKVTVESGQSDIADTAWTLILQNHQRSGQFPELGQDESYRLTISARKGLLEAQNAFGIMLGLQTFRQLIEQQGNQTTIQAATIEDAPRFSWRGLMLDVGRRFQPVPAIKRTLDGMAAVKLNVLHFHLSEDQGFRVESTQFPKLHQLASQDQYYTQDDIRTIVSYAAERGIRVIPEFDMPGHATSILVAYPKLGSRPGPYKLARAPGIYDGILDPSNEKTYEFIDAFIAEMAALFPDNYWHFGGDEVPRNVWEDNEDIRKFMAKNSIDDSRGLQAYFNRRLLTIIDQYEKQSVGWEEILHPDVDSRVVIQHWKNEAELDFELAANHPNLISRGYYLDHLMPSEYHYLQDPETLNGKLLPSKLRVGIIGGEAAMWSESVNEENLDIRLWPRLAAIAERFWSPQEVRDTADMHRRLAITEQRLHDQGLNQRRALQTYLASLTGGTLSAEMENLAAIATPVAFYNLMSWRGMASMMLPNWLARHIDPPDLNTFSNMIPVDSPAARQFDALVDEFLANPQQSKAGEIRRSLIQWSILNNALAETFSAYPQIDNLKPLAETVTQVANAGLLALAAMENDESVAPADIGKGLELLQSLALFNMENFEKDLRKRAFSWKPLILKQTDIAVVPAVEKLVRAALDEVL